MAEASLIYDTNTLIAVVPNLKRPQKFLLDKFFTNIVLSETKKVSIDVDVGKRRMSPFVSPLVEGKLVEQRRMQTNEFEPAYIKDKRAPDLMKPVRRAIGERIGGAMTGMQRQMANLEAELTDQIDMLDRRCEWMAAQALTTGTVTIEGEGFPTTLIDFGRDPSLTLAKTGGAQWTKANILAGTASPTDDIEDWQALILQKSGAITTDIVFTVSAWQGFKEDPALKGAIFFPKQSDSGNTINIGAQIARGAIYKGRWGQYDLWVYNDWYVDDITDVEMPMMQDGTVVLSGPDMMGTRAFGMIVDPKFNYEAMAYAPKTWTIEDPAQQLLLLQAAPIMIPNQVNAALCVKVV